MKVAFAVLVTVVNVAVALYAAYHSLSLVGKIGIAEWSGTTLAIVPFLLVGIYGLPPGSGLLWNWAFALNALILLLCLLANVLEFGAGSGALFATWSVTVVIALIAGLNVAFLLGLPPKSRAASTAGAPQSSDAT